MKVWRDANYHVMKAGALAYRESNHERLKELGRARRKKEKMCIEIVKKLGLPLPKNRDQQRVFSRKIIMQHFPEVLPTSNQPQKENNS
jgi:hypothetical protein